MGTSTTSPAQYLQESFLEVFRIIRSIDVITVPNVIKYFAGIFRTVNITSSIRAFNQPSSFLRKFLRPSERKSDGFIHFPAQQVQVHSVEIIHSEAPHGFSTYNETTAVENTTLARLFNSSIHSAVVTDNLTHNATDYFGQPQIPAYIRTTAMVLCILILCLGVIGNIMVPIVILKTKDMRNSTNIFLTNLSIADLLVLLVCTPTVLVEVNTPPETWVLGQEMCKAVPFVELTVAHASVLTILAISFERYYAICEPLKAGYVCTKARAILICITAWIVAALFTSPILSIATYTNETNVDGSEFAVCITAADKLWPASFFVGSIVLFFVIPFLILVVLYSVIARHLMNNPGLISYGHRHVLKYRKQVILMLSAVIFSFFVCLSPFRALTLWIIVVPPEAIMSLGFEAYYNLLYFCRIMLYLNSAINPVLYNLMSSKFRQGFFSLLRCHRLVGSKLLTGTRKGTFHTTSTNLSTSNSGDKHRRQQTEKESAAGGASGVAVGAKVAALANFDGKTQSNYGQTEIDVDLFRSAGPPPNAVTTNTTTNSQAKQPQPRVESLGGGQVDSTSNLLSIHHHESRVKFKDGPQNKDSSHDVVEREKETLIPQCNGIDDAHLQFDFEALPRLKKESFV
ncbi:growth hormone secretagogue receptor type 1 [Lutzomyia longipalpis]|uniref:growth hormone secretagogue receptor type 1 n=1 Tax=Lutzomyia longipalpis TaxID=7200 RepID=UPI002483B3BF|nr:growth hormone secretagogue receptor type 1 [Lutzomyia longipalpis]